MAFATDDDVVMNDETQTLAGVDDLARHFDVGIAGGRIAGRVVVDQDQRGRRQKKSHHCR